MSGPHGQGRSRWPGRQASDNSKLVAEQPRRWRGEIDPGDALTATVGSEHAHRVDERVVGSSLGRAMLSWSICQEGPLRPWLEPRMAAARLMLPAAVDRHRGDLDGSVTDSLHTNRMLE